MNNNLTLMRVKSRIENIDKIDEKYRASNVFIPYMEKVINIKDIISKEKVKMLKEGKEKVLKSIGENSITTEEIYFIPAAEYKDGLFGLLETNTDIFSTDESKYSKKTFAKISLDYDSSDKKLFESIKNELENIRAILQPEKLSGLIEDNKKRYLNEATKAIIFGDNKFVDRNTAGNCSVKLSITKYSDDKKENIEFTKNYILLTFNIIVVGIYDEIIIPENYNTVQLQYPHNFYDNILEGLYGKVIYRSFSKKSDILPTTFEFDINSIDIFDKNTNYIDILPPTRKLINENNFIIVIKYNNTIVEKSIIGDPEIQKTREIILYIISVNVIAKKNIKTIHHIQKSNYNTSFFCEKYGNWTLIPYITKNSERNLESYIFNFDTSEDEFSIFNRGNRHIYSSSFDVYGKNIKATPGYSGIYVKNLKFTKNITNAYKFTKTKNSSPNTSNITVSTINNSIEKDYYNVDSIGPKIDNDANDLNEKESVEKESVKKEPVKEEPIDNDKIVKYGDNQESNLVETDPPGGIYVEENQNLVQKSLSLLSSLWSTKGGSSTTPIKNKTIKISKSRDFIGAMKNSYKKISPISPKFPNNYVHKFDRFPIFTLALMVYRDNPKQFNFFENIMINYINNLKNDEKIEIPEKYLLYEDSEPTYFLLTLFTVYTLRNKNETYTNQQLDIFDGVYDEIIENQLFLIGMDFFSIVVDIMPDNIFENYCYSKQLKNEFISIFNSDSSDSKDKLYGKIKKLMPEFLIVLNSDFILRIDKLKRNYLENEFYNYDAFFGLYNPISFILTDNDSEATDCYYKIGKRDEYIHITTYKTDDDDYREFETLEKNLNYNNIKEKVHSTEEKMYERNVGLTVFKKSDISKEVFLKNVLEFELVSNYLEEKVEYIIKICNYLLFNNFFDPIPGYMAKPVMEKFKIIQSNSNNNNIFERKKEYIFVFNNFLLGYIRDNINYFMRNYDYYDKIANNTMYKNEEYDELLEEIIPFCKKFFEIKEDKDASKQLNLTYRMIRLMKAFEFHLAPGKKTEQKRFPVVYMILRIYKIAASKFKFIKKEREDDEFMDYMDTIKILDNKLFSSFSKDFTDYIKNDNVKNISNEQIETLSSHLSNNFLDFEEYDNEAYGKFSTSIRKKYKEEEERLAEEEEERLVKEEEERLAKEEEERLAKEEEERLAKEEEERLAKEEEERLAKEEEERLAKEEEERLAKEEEERLAKEEEERLAKEEEERLAKEEEERLAKEEEERLAKEEEERLAKEEEERLAKEEAERLAKEEAERKAKEEEERLAKEEEERLAKEEEERLAKEEEERLAKEEVERLAKEEEERLAKEEEERLAKEEAERLAKEEAERLAKEEEERLAKEEEERLAKKDTDEKIKTTAKKNADLSTGESSKLNERIPQLKKNKGDDIKKEEKERKVREEAENIVKKNTDLSTQKSSENEKTPQSKKNENDKLAKEEAERLVKEEEERKVKEEEERLAKEEEERLAKEEAERLAKEEAERLAKEEAERKAKEEADKKAKEEAERKAKEEAERRVKEEAKRKAKEESERLAKEKAEKIAEAEKLAKEEAEQLAKEEAERLAKEEEERLAKEAERLAKEEEERLAKEEEERLAKEEEERLAKEEEERLAKEEAERLAKEKADNKSKEEAIKKLKNQIDNMIKKMNKRITLIKSRFDSDHHKSIKKMNTEISKQIKTITNILGKFEKEDDFFDFLLNRSKFINNKEQLKIHLKALNINNIDNNGNFIIQEKDKFKSDLTTISKSLSENYGTNYLIKDTLEDIDKSIEQYSEIKSNYDQAELIIDNIDAIIKIFEDHFFFEYEQYLEKNDLSGNINSGKFKKRLRESLKFYGTTSMSNIGIDNILFIIRSIANRGVNPSYRVVLDKNKGKYIKKKPIISISVDGSNYKDDLAKLALYNNNNMNNDYSEQCIILKLIIDPLINNPINCHYGSDIVLDPTPYLDGNKDDIIWITKENKGLGIYNNINMAIKNMNILNKKMNGDIRDIITNVDIIINKYKNLSKIMHLNNDKFEFTAKSPRVNGLYTCLVLDKPFSMPFSSIDVKNIIQYYVSYKEDYLKEKYKKRLEYIRNNLEKYPNVFKLLQTYITVSNSQSYKYSNNNNGNQTILSYNHNREIENYFRKYITDNVVYDIIKLSDYDDDSRNGFDHRFNPTIPIFEKDLIKEILLDITEKSINTVKIYKNVFRSIMFFVNNEFQKYNFAQYHYETMGSYNITLSIIKYWIVYMGGIDNILAIVKEDHDIFYSSITKYPKTTNDIPFFAYLDEFPLSKYVNNNAYKIPLINLISLLEKHDLFSLNTPVIANNWNKLYIHKVNNIKILEKLKFIFLKWIELLNYNSDITSHILFRGKINYNKNQQEIDNTKIVTKYGKIVNFIQFKNDYLLYCNIYSKEIDTIDLININNAFTKDIIIPFNYKKTISLIGEKIDNIDYTYSQDILFDISKTTTKLGKSNQHKIEPVKFDPSLIESFRKNIEKAFKKKSAYSEYIFNALGKQMGIISNIYSMSNEPVLRFFYTNNFYDNVLDVKNNEIEIYIRFLNKFDEILINELKPHKEEINLFLSYLDGNDYKNNIIDTIEMLYKNNIEYINKYTDIDIHKNALEFNNEKRIIIIFIILIFIIIYKVLKKGLILNDNIFNILGGTLDIYNKDDAQLLVQIYNKTIDSKNITLLLLLKADIYIYIYNLLVYIDKNLPVYLRRGIFRNSENFTENIKNIRYFIVSQISRMNPNKMKKMRDSIAENQQFILLPRFYFFAHTYNSIYSDSESINIYDTTIYTSIVEFYDNMTTKINAKGYIGEVHKYNNINYYYSYFRHLFENKQLQHNIENITKNLDLTTPKFDDFMSTYSDIINVLFKNIDKIIKNHVSLRLDNEKSYFPDIEDFNNLVAYNDIFSGTLKNKIINTVKLMIDLRDIVNGNSIDIDKYNNGMKLFEEIGKIKSEFKHNNGKMLEFESAYNVLIENYIAKIDKNENHNIIYAYAFVNIINAKLCTMYFYTMIESLRSPSGSIYSYISRVFSEYLYTDIYKSSGSADIEDDQLFDILKNNINNYNDSNKDIVSNISLYLNEMLKSNRLIFDDFLPTVIFWIPHIIQITIGFCSIIIDKKEIIEKLNNIPINLINYHAKDGYIIYEQAKNEKNSHLGYLCDQMNNVFSISTSVIYSKDYMDKPKKSTKSFWNWGF